MTLFIYKEMHMDVNTHTSKHIRNKVSPNNTFLHMGSIIFSFFFFHSNFNSTLHFRKLLAKGLP